MQLLNKKIPNGNDRFVAVSKMWKQLPGKEKEKYKIKMREKQKKYNVELKKWFKVVKYLFVYIFFLVSDGN